MSAFSHIGHVFAVLEKKGHMNVATRITTKYITKTAQYAGYSAQPFLLKMTEYKHTLLAHRRPHGILKMTKAEAQNCHT